MTADAITAWLMAKKEYYAAFQLQLCVVFSPDYQGAFEGCSAGGEGPEGGEPRRLSRPEDAAQHAPPMPRQSTKWILREVEARVLRILIQKDPVSVDCVYVFFII